MSTNRKRKRDSAKPPPHVFDEDTVRNDYQKNLLLYESLSEEVAFILGKSIEDANIKIHAIEHRIKSADSIIVKARARECASPLEEIRDIVGARIICLFKDDLNDWTVS